MTALFGVWTAIAPWVLGFTGLTFALWTHVVVGVLVAGLAAWALLADQSEAQRQH